MILWSDDNGGTMPRKRYAKTFEIAFPTVFANKKMALIKPCSSSPSYRLFLSFRLVVRESTDQASPLIKNTPISTLWNHVSRIRSVSFSSPASMIDGWIHATDRNRFSSTSFRGCVVCVTASWYVDIVGMFSVFPTLARTSVVAKVIAVRGNKMAKIWRKLNLPFFDDISLFLPLSFPIREGIPYRFRYVYRVLNRDANSYYLSLFKMFNNILPKEKKDRISRRSMRAMRWIFFRYWAASRWTLRSGEFRLSGSNRYYVV